MTSPSDSSAASIRGRARSWIIKLAILLLVVEVGYVITANFFLRSGKLLELVNTKPEKMEITWDSAVTYLPGVAAVENFELRAQTKKDQVYVRVAEADARISLLKLALKTIHIRGVGARDVDFRYRERLDRPPKAGREDQPRPEPSNVEYWPEIPGYSNPPDPKPEEIYEIKRKKRPWTIKITGADVEGPVSVALNEIRIDADGTVAGGVTVRPRRSITIHRGRLDLDPTSIIVGPDIVTRNLVLHADLRCESFPAKGASFADILGGISGELSAAGDLGRRGAVRYTVTPGVSVSGAGVLAALLNLEKGVLRAGSRYSLISDAFHVTIMDLHVNGGGRVAGQTIGKGGEHTTNLDVDLGEFRFIEPTTGRVDVTGSGLTLDAEWDNLLLGGSQPARRVDIVIPTARLHDISSFNALIPEQTALTLESGNGEVDARLEIIDRSASGTVDLVADDVLITSGETRFTGDLDVDAVLTEGDLEQRRFDFAGTTIAIADIADSTQSERKQQRVADWYGKVRLAAADAVLAKPLRATGRIELELFDTRPVVSMLRKLGAGPKWLSLAPNIRGVKGALNLEIGPEIIGITDLALKGDGFEALGWMQVRGEDTNGRLFARFKAVMAGVSIDQGKAKVHLSKPRKWFEEQPRGPEQ